MCGWGGEGGEALLTPMAEARHQLYEIYAAGTWGTRFTYASGYTPLPDRKSFVPPQMQERERQFTELNGFKPGIRIDGKGTLWPDFLPNGSSSFVMFFVSERVITDLTAGGFEFIDATEF